MSKKKNAQQVPEPVRFRHLLASDLPAAERLLASNPPLLNAAAYGSESALHFWAVENRPDIVSWLLARGADPNAATESTSPLFDVATLGNVEVCQLLVEAGADPGFRDPSGETPLHRAAAYGRLAICELLLAAGADPNATENCGETPWDQALPRKREAIRSLLEAHR